jgi:hypothetical protein
MNKMQLGAKEKYGFLTKWRENRPIEKEKNGAARTDKFHKWQMELFSSNNIKKESCKDRLKAVILFVR